MTVIRDRLEPLLFLPPSTGKPWSVAPVQALATKIKRCDGGVVDLDCPLFWYDPAWHRIETILADIIATCVAQSGIVVSALRSDLDTGEEVPSFHAAHLPGGSSDVSATACALRRLPRMVPYRPERYGLMDKDFDDASIIDVRLTIARDETGRFAYSPEQIARWESSPDDQPLAGGGWVPAATFPPDVPSLSKLSSKLDQLRALSPSAAIFVSMSPYRLDQELPVVLKQKPDGVILRVDDHLVDGLILAAMTRRARQWMKHANVPEMPLWIVPGKVTAEDAAKLIGLGASAVAIDHWCDPIIDQAAETADRSGAARLGYKSMRSSQEQVLMDLVHFHLDDAVDRFKGLAQSLAMLPPEEKVASLDTAWAKALGVPYVSFGIQST